MHLCDTCLLSSAGPEGNTEGGDLTEKEGRALDRLVSRIQDAAVPLWVVGGAITAAGRVLADVHWYLSRRMQKIEHVKVVPACPLRHLAAPLTQHCLGARCCCGCWAGRSRLQGACSPTCTATMLHQITLREF